jgi:hypothetical protein
MKNILVTVGLILLCIVAIVILQFAVLGNRAYFAPKSAAVDRKVFEQTQSFQQGSIRDFDNLYLAYVRSIDPQEKAALLDTMRHRAAGAPQDVVPPRVRVLLGKE